MIATIHTHTLDLQKAEYILRIFSDLKQRRPFVRFKHTDGGFPPNNCICIQSEWKTKIHNFSLIPIWQGHRDDKQHELTGQTTVNYSIAHHIRIKVQYATFLFCYGNIYQRLWKFFFLLKRKFIFCWFFTPVSLYICDVFMLIWLQSRITAPLADFVGIFSLPLSFSPFFPLSLSLFFSFSLCVCTFFALYKFLHCYVKRITTTITHVSGIEWQTIVWMQCNTLKSCTCTQERVQRLKILNRRTKNNMRHR